METNGRLTSQVAAQAGCTTDTAMVAVYLSDLSRAGKTLDEAAALMRLERCDVRDYARDWGIDFPDYSPSQPALFVWSKERRGLWQLKSEAGEVTAQAESAGRGTYVADRDDLVEHGSNAEVAMRRLSRQIDRRSRYFFGVDDICIVIRTSEGDIAVAPKVAPDAGRLQRALVG